MTIYTDIEIMRMIDEQLSQKINAFSLTLQEYKNSPHEQLPESITQPAKRAKQSIYSSLETICSQRLNSMIQDSKDQKLKDFFRRYIPFARETKLKLEEFPENTPNEEQTTSMITTLKQLRSFGKELGDSNFYRQYREEQTFPEKETRESWIKKGKPRIESYASLS
jgi:hypothetical protein